MEIALNSGKISNFTLSNKSLKNISKAFSDICGALTRSKPDECLKAANESLEAEMLSTSIQKDNLLDNKEYLFQKMQPYIDQRNEILKSMFKRYLPIYKNKLKKIDVRLNNFELQLYEIEAKNLPTQDELNKILFSARESEKRCKELLTTILQKKLSQRP